MRTEPIFLIVDLFCGAGGTTTGFDMAHGYAKVIACVNHDPKAIKSHWLNHPEVKHFEEDIRTLKLEGLIEVVNYWKNVYPDALLILWASLECTNFSKAKGGQPRDADSRTLADHLGRYILALNPDYVQIENVVEFMSWGPLDENGKPVSKKNGQDWMRWRNVICAHGYKDEWREMNSANYGAYTSRNRLFGIFAKDGLPTAWPAPTHAKKPSTFSMHGDLEKWKAVKDVLNFKDEGESILTRNKALSDKTLERIYAGLIKYVAKGDKAFISKYYFGRPAGKVNSIDDPSSTVTTFGSHTLVQPEFLAAHYSNGHNISSVLTPCPTISTKDRFQFVQPKYLVNYNHSSKVNDVNEPAPTILTKDKIAVVQPQYFIDKHYGTAQNQSIDQPAGTILPTDKHRLVEATPYSYNVRINCDCGNVFETTQAAYLKEPCPKCGGFSGTVSFLNCAEPFIMPTNYENGPKSIDEPLQTITANRKHHYIVNPSHGGHSTSTEAPCPVIVARQDKAPLYLVQCEQGRVAIAVYQDDSDIMIKIKEFMVVYELVDIKMRMLRVNELLKIQGFPEGYQLEGNQADQKKFIGNSVVPHVVKAWTVALAERIIEETKTKVA